MIRSFPTAVAAPVLTLSLVSAAAPHASAVATLTGDPTTTLNAGLTLVGNSFDADLQSVNQGAGFSYDVYVGRYNVSATDTVLVTPGTDVVGNTGEGATGGAFNVGDDIYVIGWKATQPAGGTALAGNNGFLKINPNGNAGYRLATDPGGAAGSFTSLSEAGDTQLSTSTNFGNEFRFVDYRFNNGTSPTTYPLQSGTSSGSFDRPLADLPFRTFGIDESGTDGSSSERLSSQLFLLNVSDLNAGPHPSTFGVQPADIGSNLKFFLELGNPAEGGLPAGSTAVIVPEPASAAALAIGGMVLLRRRRADR